MRTYTLKPRLALITLAVLVTGCAQQYEPTADFGSAVREAIVRQTLNAEGVGHERVTPGMDGPSAKATVDRYIKSMEQPPSLGDVLKIGVDTGASK